MRVCLHDNDNDNDNECILLISPEYNDETHTSIDL